MPRDMTTRFAGTFPHWDIRHWLDLRVQYDTWQAEQYGNPNEVQRVARRVRLIRRMIQHA